MPGIDLGISAMAPFVTPAQPAAPNAAGMDWKKFMALQQMMQQPEQQRPQHAPPLYRPQPISLQELMQRYGLLA